MFDIGWSELFVIDVVALVVLGPKELPALMRTLGQWTRAAQRMAREFRGHVDDIMRESELEDLKRDVNSLRNPIGNILDPGTGPEAKPETPPSPPVPPAPKQGDPA